MKREHLSVNASLFHSSERFSLSGSRASTLAEAVPSFCPKERAELSRAALPRGRARGQQVAAGGHPGPHRPPPARAALRLGITEGKRKEPCGYPQEASGL